MKKTIRIEVIKTYDIDVDAENDNDAIEKASRLPSIYIEDVGVRVDVTTDFVEVV